MDIEFRWGLQPRHFHLSAGYYKGIHKPYWWHRATETTVAFYRATHTIVTTRILLNVTNNFVSTPTLMYCRLAALQFLIQLDRDAHAHRHADLKSTHPIANAAHRLRPARRGAAPLSRDQAACAPPPPPPGARAGRVAFHRGAVATHCVWRRSLPPPASGTLKAPSPSTRS